MYQGQKVERALSQIAAQAGIELAILRLPHVYGGPDLPDGAAPVLAVGSYALLSRTLARAAIRRAFLFNAEFEDHAEHYCAELVGQHPEWKDQPVTSKLVREYGSFRSWADVFRRVGLGEHDHRNASFAFAGRPELIVEYAGMPAAPGPD